jgi:Phage integrase family
MAVGLPAEGGRASVVRARSKRGVPDSRLAIRAGVRRRFAPHQLRHAHAVEMAREGVALNVIQRQLGHANLGITSVYLQGIDNSEIMDTTHAGQPRCCKRERSALTVVARSSSAACMRAEPSRNYQRAGFRRRCAARPEQRFYVTCSKLAATLRTPGARRAGRPGALCPSGRLASGPGQARCPGRRRGIAACPGRRPPGRRAG